MATTFKVERVRIVLSFRREVRMMTFILNQDKILLKRLFPYRSIHSNFPTEGIRSLTLPGVGGV